MGCCTPSLKTEAYWRSDCRGRLMPIDANNDASWERNDGTRCDAQAAESPKNRASRVPLRRAEQTPAESRMRYPPTP